jgi:hypothetical protein
MWLHFGKKPLSNANGAIFVKGSRRYQLERALPAALAPASAHV